MRVTRRLIALLASSAMVATGLAIAAVPPVQAATITFVLPANACDSTTTLEVPSFVAKADNLVLSAPDSSCQGFDRPSGNFNFTSSSGSFTGTSPFGSLTFTNRKQQSALSSPLVELRKSGSAIVITVINSTTARATTNFLAKNPPGGQVGVAYDYLFEVDGSPVEFTRSSGTLPPGVTLNLDGRLQGTPSSAGSYTFNVKAYNLSTESEALSGNVTVVIEPAASAVWTQRTPPNGIAGSSYGPYTFVASGGTETYSVSGDLPLGLSLSTSGVLSGTPTQTGTFTFVVSKDGQTENSGPVSIAVRAPAIDKVTICHRTSATTNPYVMITVSVNSVISGGANGHQHHNTTLSNQINPITGAEGGSGPFDSNYDYPPNRKWWGDIIPPFTHSGGSFSGLNWGPDWEIPNPASGADRTRDNWLEPNEFATAVSATNDVYRRAVALCMDLGTGVESPQAQAVNSPQSYFDVMVNNGTDPDQVHEDLEHQEALEDPVNPTPTRRVIPPTANLVATFQSTAAVVETKAASGVGQTTATLNGELKALSTPRAWASWGYEWSTSRDTVRDGDGTSTSSATAGAGPISPALSLTGLTCATNYYFRVLGVDDLTPTGNRYFGLIRTFRTANCGSGGGGGGGGASSTPTGPSVPPQSNRPPGAARPQTILVLPPANPIVETNQTPGTNPANTPGNTVGGTQQSQSPRQITPTSVLPPPPGEQWDPQEVRLSDPNTGAPTTRVVNNQGTWVVNTNTGSVTFTPAPTFTGTAILNVQLSARSGRIYIYPIRVVVSPTSRVLVVKGDVPRDIKGGVVRRP
jgi:CshA-type fibril repeat protein